MENTVWVTLFITRYYNKVMLEHLVTFSFLACINSVLFFQVGMMLRGMGFGNNTPIYVASGKIYNAEKYMAPLRQMFPLLETKETLASADELAQFKVS